jgi:hypothetical protein
MADWRRAFDRAFFKDPPREGDFPIIQGHEGVDVIRRQDIRPEPRAMVRPGFGEALQALVDRRRGENLCAVLGIGRNEVDRISFEKPFETAQALGHEQTVAAVWDRRKKKEKEFLRRSRSAWTTQAFA